LPDLSWSERWKLRISASAWLVSVNVDVHRQPAVNSHLILGLRTGYYPVVDVIQ
jgi:hypothetical protein